MQLSLCNRCSALVSWKALNGFKVWHLNLNVSIMYYEQLSKRSSSLCAVIRCDWTYRERLLAQTLDPALHLWMLGSEHVKFVCGLQIKGGAVFGAVGYLSFWYLDALSQSDHLFVVGLAFAGALFDGGVFVLVQLQPWHAASALRHQHTPHLPPSLKSTHAHHRLKYFSTYTLKSHVIALHNKYQTKQYLKEKAQRH